MTWLLFGAHALAADLTIPYEKYELPNGLDVVLVEDHSTPIVHVNVWYHVGARDEEEGLTGFAHLFEHLMFNGSPSQPGEYFAPLEKVGAALNGTTNSDRTNYYETVPSEFLPLALFLESDRMGWLLDDLNADKLANQQDVVRNERRQRYENVPYGGWWVNIFENVYDKDYPYHHPTIGSHEDVAGAKIEDVKAFFTKWYVPNNASLVIAGDFDSKEAKKLVKEYFSNIKKGDLPERVYPDVKPLEADKKVIREEDVPQPKIFMGWQSPALYAQGDAELDLFSSVLGAGTDSRLYQELVLNQKIASDVSAAQWSGGLASTYMINASALPGHTTEELEAAVLKVLNDTIEGELKPTNAELEAARAQAEKSFYQSMTTITQKADRMNGYNRAFGKPDSWQRDLDRYLNPSPEEVLAQAKETFGAHHVTVHFKVKPIEQPKGAEPEIVETEKEKKKRLKAEKKAEKKRLKLEKKKAQADGEADATVEVVK